MSLNVKSPEIVDIDTSPIPSPTDHAAAATQAQNIQANDVGSKDPSEGNVNNDDSTELQNDIDHASDQSRSKHIPDVPDSQQSNNGSFKIQLSQSHTPLTTPQLDSSQGKGGNDNRIDHNKPPPASIPNSQKIHPEQKINNNQDLPSQNDSYQQPRPPPTSSVQPYNRISSARPEIRFFKAHIKTPIEVKSRSQSDGQSALSSIPRTKSPLFRPGTAYTDGLIPPPPVYFDQQPYSQTPRSQDPLLTRKPLQGAQETYWRHVQNDRSSDYPVQLRAKEVVDKQQPTIQHPRESRQLPQSQQSNAEYQLDQIGSSPSSQHCRDTQSFHSMKNTDTYHPRYTKLGQSEHVYDMDECSRVAPATQKRPYPDTVDIDAHDNRYSSKRFMGENPTQVLPKNEHILERRWDYENDRSRMQTLTPGFDQRMMRNRINHDTEETLLGGTDGDSGPDREVSNSPLSRRGDEIQDPTQPIPRFNIHEELVVVWESLQNELKPLIENANEIILTQAMELICHINWSFDTMNTSIREDLEIGSKSIETEERKQEEIRKTINNFVKEINQCKQVLASFGQQFSMEFE